RAAQARSRQGAGLDEEGRAAVRPRDALPRCRRHHEAGKAQQSGKGGPAQGTQGQGRGSHQGQGSRRRGGQDGGDRQGRYRQGRGRQGQGGKAGRSTGGELNFLTLSPCGRGWSRERSERDRVRGKFHAKTEARDSPLTRPAAIGGSAPPWGGGGGGGARGGRRGEGEISCEDGSERFPPHPPRRHRRLGTLSPTG